MRVSFKDIDTDPTAECMALSEAFAKMALQDVDLSDFPKERQRKELSHYCQRLQSQFSLTKAPLFKAVYFKLSGTEGRLLLLAHHLLVDGVSWRVIVADLESAYRSLLEGHEIELAPKTTSLREWGNQIRRLAESPAVQQQLKFWQGRLSASSLTVPGNTRERDQHQTLMFSLSVEQTQFLLGNANAASREKEHEQ